jgi:hypothetical protein
MKVSQGNSLCSYLKQAKMSFFSFQKIREQEGGSGPAFGIGTSGRGRRWVKCVENEYGANTVYTCM